MEYGSEASQLLFADDTALAADTKTARIVYRIWKDVQVNESESGKE